MPNKNNIKSFKILNVNIHATNLENLKLFFEDIFFSQTHPQLITTFNLDFLRITTIDKDFLNICNKSLLNLPDGYGIINIVKKKYNEKVTRITGTDVFLLLVSLAQKYNLKIALIGGTNYVSKKTEDKLIKQYKIASENLLCIAPEYEFENIDKINNNVIQKITDFKPDITFVALGCPRQEKWLFKNMNHFGSKVNIGIGATLDFFTGAKKRSPVFMQKLGLEWLWRLVNEPGRLFKRYVIYDLPFFLRIFFFGKN